MATEAQPAESILTQAAHGQRAMLFSHAVRVVCKICSVLVLARLVGPAEQGLYAMAATLTLFLTIFRDFGLGTAAVQARDLSEEECTALFWAHAALGVLLTVLTLALVPPLVWFYGEPRLAPLAACMSVSFVFIGLNNWPRSLLARRLQFQTVNRLETTSVLIGTAAMIAAGALGAGAYSFAVFLLVNEASATVTAWRACGWRPRARANWRHLGALARTGLDVTGYSIVLFFSQQLDTLLVGKWFGPRTLGLYNRSAQFLQLPALHIAAPLSQVMLATLSRLGVTAPEFRTHVRHTANLVLHLSLPPAVLCFVLPREMTLLVLGRAWLDAAPFLRWMALNAALTAATATAYALCVATGHTRRLHGLAFLGLAANAVTLALARQLDAAHIALALATTNFILLLPRLRWIVAGTPVSVADYAGALAGPCATALTLGLGLAGGAACGAHSPGFVRMLEALAGGILALGLLTAFSSRVRGELRRVWQQRPHLRGMFAPAGDRPS